MNGKKQSIGSEQSLLMGRVPPSAKDVENEVIGLILLQGEFIDQVPYLLTAECFYQPSLVTIFGEMLEMASKNKKIDIFNIADSLNKKQKLNEIGGVPFLSTLSGNADHSIPFDDYCKIIYEKWMLREMIQACGETLVSAYDNMDAFDVMDEHEKKITRIGANQTDSAIITALDASVAALEKIDQLRANKGQMTGVTTGYTQMDRLTNGWQAPDLIILAARPSMGKTALALNLLKNAAKAGVPGAFFSLEMSTKQLMNRILSEDSGVPLENISRGKMTDQEYTDFVKATDRVAALPMFFDDTASLNVFQLKSKVRGLVKKHGVRFIIIDYLQLMSGLRSKNDNREQEISTISRSLKALAKELNIPIIALSQLSRAVESRDGNKPKLSDLRESGAIEQDADIVGFIYRPDYQKEEKDIDPMDANKGFVSFKKHRNGALETLAFHVDLSIQKWSDPFDFQTQQANMEGWQQLPDNGASLYIQNNFTEEPPF